MANSIFVLIIIFGTSTNAAGISSMSQEFYSEAACLSAGKALLSDMKKPDRAWAFRVVSWGCFKKGE